jgi:hypothetical protein
MLLALIILVGVLGVSGAKLVKKIRKTAANRKKMRIFAEKYRKLWQQLMTRR